MQFSERTSIKIGTALYEHFGAMAQGLSARFILDKLEQTSQSLLPKSRVTHWCLIPRSNK